jgi:ACS family hexuronate transporter-like MFS transporter
MQNFGSNLLGSFVSPLVLVAIASTFIWRWAFFLSGVPGLIMALLIAKFIHRPAAPASTAGAGPPPAGTNMG